MKSLFSPVEISELCKGNIPERIEKALLDKWKEDSSFAVKDNNNKWLKHRVITEARNQWHGVWTASKLEQRLSARASADVTYEECDMAEMVNSPSGSLSSRIV